MWHELIRLRALITSCLKYIEFLSKSVFWVVDPLAYALVFEHVRVSEIAELMNATILIKTSFGVMHFYVFLTCPNRKQRNILSKV